MSSYATITKKEENPDAVTTQSPLIEPPLESYESDSESVTLESQEAKDMEDDGFTLVCRRQRTKTNKGKKPDQDSPDADTTSHIYHSSNNHNNTEYGDRHRGYDGGTSGNVYHQGHGRGRGTQYVHQQPGSYRRTPSRGCVAPTRGASRRAPNTPHYSREERELHKAALSRARKYALSELQLPKEWMVKRLEEIKFSIDPRTGAPYAGYFESFRRIRLQKVHLMGESKTLRELEDDVVDPETGHKFSRQKFYESYHFQAELVDYYWELLKTENSYCGVKVAYYKDSPHLKVGFPTLEDKQHQQHSEPPSAPVQHK